jgi:hypothetical protein|tara:strand:- start:292 stop:444 length:153 start_codon:yes stop_codon:yes gene_type:complete
MSAMPDFNHQEKLILRCYFKQIITVGGLTDRLSKILSKGDHAKLKKLVSS